MRKPLECTICGEKLVGVYQTYSYADYLFMEDSGYISFSDRCDTMDEDVMEDDLCNIFCPKCGWSAQTDHNHDLSFGELREIVLKITEEMRRKENKENN